MADVLKKLRDFLAKLGLTIAVVVTMLMPLWSWLLAFLLLDPSSFWGKTLVFGIGPWFLGAFQLILLGVLGFALYAIWE